MTAQGFLVTQQAWMRDAPCRGATAAFFAERGPAAARLVKQAKKVCAGCPVSDQCLEYALENREPCGVWGGLTPVQRRKLASGHTRAPVAIPPCGSNRAYNSHLKRGEEACRPCKDAHADYVYAFNHPERVA